MNCAQSSVRRGGFGPTVTVTLSSGSDTYPLATVAAVASSGLGTWVSGAQRRPSGLGRGFVEHQLRPVSDGLSGDVTYRSDFEAPAAAAIRSCRSTAFNYAQPSFWFAHRVGCLRGTDLCEWFGLRQDIHFASSGASLSLRNTPPPDPRRGRRQAISASQRSATSGLLRML